MLVSLLHRFCDKTGISLNHTKTLLLYVYLRYPLPAYLVYAWSQLFRRIIVRSSLLYDSGLLLRESYEDY